MTDGNKHYTKGTLRPSKPAEDYYPETDWGWYFVGAATTVVCLAWGGAWLIDTLVTL
jgi:hypothetical protein